MSERLLCAVPGCRRTRKADPELIVVEGVVIDLFEEWICGDHWRVVPHIWRRRNSLVKRRLRNQKTAKLASLGGKIWARCKRDAIESAVGLK